MKIKVSDYVTAVIEKHGINTVFSITGGFAMHLNDSFGNGSFNVYYQHHEHACGYAAVGYSKTLNKPSVVCTTSGCAATNAISPCLVAYHDSVPVLFISGQVNTIDIERSNQNNLRNYSPADSKIASSVASMTKYSCEILDVKELKESLKKAMYELTTGRPGPVWVSIPLNIQGMLIEDDIVLEVPKTPVQEIPDLNPIYDLLRNAKRPVLLIGNGIKLGRCEDKFRTFLEKYKIPIVCTWFSTDIINTDNEFFGGKVGIYGDRTGNFIIQNADLVISLGCRFSQPIIGYNTKWFAREAKIVYIDIDVNELQKTNLDYTLKLQLDLNLFFDTYNFHPVFYNEWITKCNHWKKKWQYELPPLQKDVINPYKVLNRFFTVCPSNSTFIMSSGTATSCVWHMIRIKKKDSFISSSQGDMGFELPASIGCHIANKDKTIVAFMGEGSFQLNLQELQTIVHYKMPIKIFICNNSAYGAIDITQKTYFKKKNGVGIDSGLSFPSTEKIAKAYDIQYIGVKSEDQLDTAFTAFLTCTSAVILEVFTCIQTRYPKMSAVKNEDGTFTNRPFEDMEPFLDRDEFTKEMIIKPI
jgi:acetolactate synthase-1/2/3 large subunit